METLELAFFGFGAVILKISAEELRLGLLHPAYPRLMR